MAKAYWISAYRAIKDPDKLAAYAKLAGPALSSNGGRFLARGEPAKVYELGLKQRTVLIVKKHRRQHFDRRNGHRQMLSTVRIGEILLGGAKPTLVVDKKLRAKAAALETQTAVIAAPVAEAPKPAKKAPAKKAPAKAAEPKGIVEMRGTESFKRSTSRWNIQKYANKWCASETGCACCK